MSDETTAKTDKKPWGRYEHESGAWIQFKPGPYRYREQREWKASKVEVQLYAFILTRLESWHFPDGDGRPLDLDALRGLAVAALKTPAADADDATRAAALAALERFEAAFDEVEVPMLRWLVQAGSTFVFVDMLSAPKA